MGDWNPRHPELHRHEPGPHPGICPSCRVAGQMALLSVACFLLAGVMLAFLVWVVIFR